MLLAAALLTAFLGSPVEPHRPAPPPRGMQAAPACLHDRGSETPDQLDRRRRALGLARTVNSAEAAYSTRHAGSYGALDDLIGGDFVKQPPASGEHVPGFQLHLDVAPKGYWFEVVDKTDPCGFRYISNQNGVIFEAQPIR